MSDTNINIVQANDNKLSIEQLRSFPGMEKYSDIELKELAEFLKEFSLILYDVFSKSTSDHK